MVDEVTTDRTPEEWQSVVDGLFPQSVQVVPSRDGFDDFTARPGRVYTDYDDGKTYWSLGVSETHEELLPMAGAKDNGDGTMSFNAYGGHTLVRPSNDKWV